MSKDEQRDERKRAMGLAPGEQETVAKMARETALSALASSSANKRYRGLTYWCIGLAIGWVALYFVVRFWLIDFIMSWAIGYKIHIEPLSYSGWWMLGLIVGATIYYNDPLRGCRERGNYITVGRRKISKSLLSVLAVLSILCIFVLLAFHGQMATLSSAEEALEYLAGHEDVWVLTALLSVDMAMLISFFYTYAMYIVYVPYDVLLKEERSARGLID